MRTILKHASRQAVGAGSAGLFAISANDDSVPGPVGDCCLDLLNCRLIERDEDLLG